MLDTTGLMYSLLFSQLQPNAGRQFGLFQRQQNPFASLLGQPQGSSDMMSMLMLKFLMSDGLDILGSTINDAFDLNNVDRSTRTTTTQTRQNNNTRDVGRGNNADRTRDARDTRGADRTRDTREVREVREIRGADDGQPTTFKDGVLTLSIAALNEIDQNPGTIKTVIQRELEKILGSNDVSTLIDKLTGVKIATTTGHVWKQLGARQFYEDILWDYTTAVRQGNDVETAPLTGPAKTTFVEAGVVLSQTTLDKIRNAADDAAIEKIIRDEIFATSGTTDVNKTMKQIIKDTRNYNMTSLLNNLVNDLVKRTKVQQGLT